MKALDLRTRVAAAVAITCIAVVAALALTLYTASEDLEETLVDQIVKEEMDFLVRHHAEHPGIAREPGPNLQYYVVRTPEDLLRMPAALRDLGAGVHEIGQGINEQHVAIREIDGTRFIVAYDAGPHEMREEQFRRLVLFALVTVMIVAAALGYWIAGLITRQITDLSGRVGILDPGTPHAPLMQPGQDPEVTALAAALDRYQARIRQLIEREQEFTGNASHELRTPLTAIRTSCELLESDAGLPEKARSRIAAISAAAVRMTAQLELLLSLARGQIAGIAKVALSECVNDVVQALLPEITRKNLAFENAIPANAALTINRQAFEIVITNLLRNAVMYTDRGHIRVDFEDDCLTVSDSGLGIAPEELPHIFDRFHRVGSHGEGSGLGLAIVKRICSHHGWRINAQSTPSKGSVFRIRFS